MDSSEMGGDVVSGRLVCQSCRRSYLISQGVPRFVGSDNYASNFGFQWNHFRQTQLDSYSGLSISRDRLLRQTGWLAKDFAGKTVLDVGCGTGRFAEVALSFGANVIAMDYSSAVDACWDNLKAIPQLNVVQADIYSLPFRRGSFDLVYCLGVLQHTPDVKKSFASLPPLLAEGGLLVVDSYLRSMRSLCHPRFLFRVVTKRMRPEKLFPLIQSMTPSLLKLSRLVGRIPGIGRYFSRLIPVANYEGVYPLTERQLVEWATLDTFDWLSPRYDQPQAPAVLQEWFKEAGMTNIEVFLADHLTARGCRPHPPASVPMR
jgi:2-polyprenyl-3-methyl-5-hydroxy-6-metoxy-1,4-benzoquinol methylase